MSYSPPPVSAGPAAPAPLRWYQRAALVTGGAILLGLLGTAAYLKPSPAGYGTHRQLNLPPCTIVQWYGIRCPSCGMTTSWAHVVRGHVPSALRANVGGTLLAVVAIFAGPWLFGTGLAGRWLGGPPSEGLTLAIGVAIVVVTLIEWSIRLNAAP